MSTIAAISSSAASVSRLAPPLALSVVRPLVISSTISVPTADFVTDPLPPPSVMPPSTVAVSTITSMPTPMSPPTVPSRAAKNRAPMLVSAPQAT